MPTLAFGGREAAAADPGPGRTAAEAAGRGRRGGGRPRGRSFGGLGRDARPGVVLFKVSYDPRWQATVDGEPAPTQMLVAGVGGRSGSRGRTRGRSRPIRRFRGPGLLLLGRDSRSSRMWFLERSPTSTNGRRPEALPRHRVGADRRFRGIANFRQDVLCLGRFSADTATVSVSHGVHGSVQGQATEGAHVHRKSRRWATPIAVIAILGLIAGATLASASVIRRIRSEAAMAQVQQDQGLRRQADPGGADHPDEQELQEG